MTALPSREAGVFVRTDEDEDRFLPEGPRPITLDGRDALIWVNIQTAPDATRGALHVYYPDDEETGVWNLPGRPGFVFPTDRPGTVLVGVGKQVGTVDLETNEFRPLATIPDDNPRTIINDGEVAMVVNTPTGKSARADGYEIRAATTGADKPIITTVQELAAAVQGIEARRSGEIRVKSLQDHARDLDLFGAGAGR